MLYVCFFCSLDEVFLLGLDLLRLELFSVLVLVGSGGMVVLPRRSTEYSFPLTFLDFCMSAGLLSVSPNDSFSFSRYESCNSLILVIIKYHLHLSIFLWSYSHLVDIGKAKHSCYGGFQENPVLLCHSNICLGMVF